MDKRVLRERMRRKQQQIRRRRMMKRITCVFAAILLLVFVVRGVILPIVNRVGGGSSKDTETVNVQANTAGTSSDGSTEDASASADSATSDSSGDSSTDAVVMPIKGSTAGDRLSVMTPGWHEDSTGKWYQNPDGTYYINGFAEIDGTTYSFDENGYMQTGWVEKGVKDYYFNEDGSYDPSKKRPMIALTFDDGPGEYTETLLDTVEKYNIHVTSLCWDRMLRDGNLLYRECYSLDVRLVTILGIIRSRLFRIWIWILLYRNSRKQMTSW